MKYFFLLTLFSVNAFASKAITVPVHFLEALSPKDTTSSERFQREYESAISLAKKLTSKELEKCGYRLEEKTFFYNASDGIESLEKAKQAESSGAWLLVGPRRSNHYILLAKGASSTPSVSTMASSDEIDSLGSLHLTIAPMNRQMAKVAAQEAKKRFPKTPTYISVVSEDCVTCVDFASHFETISKTLGIKQLKEVRISGETPSLIDAAQAVKELKPSFVLLPNYSKVSAQAMSAIYKADPNILFIGGDGWGDSKFGFVQNASELEKVRGITVRGFPPVENALKEFDLGKAILQNKDMLAQFPGSGSAIGILKIIEETTAMLCKHKPKNKTDFKAVFEKNGKSNFNPPWGVSIYELRNGDIKFQSTVRI